jgi:uncharacterized protein (DUF885 family)
MVAFLTANRLVTIPAYLGPFLIRQLPEAFKPTSPGGFMNPPGLYDADSSGFYFIPSYNPRSGNFYIRAAIEDPRPILGHEGIPGHFLQISIANHLERDPPPARRRRVVEGWALYTEEMLMRTGFYPDNSASQGQVLRLSRYRAARIGVDVNLQTDGGPSIRRCATSWKRGPGSRGRAGRSRRRRLQPVAEDHLYGRQAADPAPAREVSRPSPDDFRLGAFHDDLLRHGSLPSRSSSG